MHRLFALTGLSVFKNGKRRLHKMARTKKVETVEEQPAQNGIRGFKSSSDVESFYRFVHENDFRREAKVMLQAVHDLMKKEAKSKKKKRSRKKLQ